MPVLAGERKGMQISRSALEVKEQRGGTAVRVLTSHQAARVQIPASMPYVGWVCCWFSPLLREVFLRVLQFSPLLKTNICKFSFDQESGQRRTTMQMCYLQIIIYLFRGEEQGCAIVAPGDPLGRLLHCKIIFHLVHTYLDIFENGEYFLLWKKFMSTHTCSISKSFFAHPYKKGKTMEINRVH